MRLDPHRRVSFLWIRRQQRLRKCWPQWRRVVPSLPRRFPGLLVFREDTLAALLVAGVEAGRPTTS